MMFLPIGRHVISNRTHYVASKRGAPWQERH